MSTEDIREKFENLETNDVAEKRLRMFKIFEELLNIKGDGDTPVEELEEIKDIDGYMYKLSQDFLLSSSTMEKEKKLGKIIEHVKRND